jgi:hypothetical protein
MIVLINETLPTEAHHLKQEVRGWRAQTGLNASFFSAPADEVRRRHHEEIKAN